MRTLITYYIAGWVIKVPFITPNIRDKINKGEKDERDLARHIKLILIDDEGNVMFKHYGLLYMGMIRHGINKASTYFQFVRATTGIKNVKKATLLKNQPDNFIDSFVSYDIVLEKWVKTPESKKFKPIVSPLLHMCANSSMFEEVSLSYKLKEMI